MTDAERDAEIARLYERIEELRREIRHLGCGCHRDPAGNWFQCRDHQVVFTAVRPENWTVYY